MIAMTTSGSITMNPVGKEWAKLDRIFSPREFGENQAKHDENCKSRPISTGGTLIHGEEPTGTVADLRICQR